MMKGGAARVRYQRRVRELAGMGHRGSGTGQERQAALYLCNELQSLGLEPEIQPFPGRTSFAAPFLLHLGIAAVGLMMLPLARLATALLGALALISLVVEQTTRAHLLSRVLIAVPSQNVVARIPSRSGSPRLRLVVAAHYDTQRTGIFWRALAASRALANLMSRVPAPLRSPLFPVTAGLALEVLIGAAALIAKVTPVCRALAAALLLVYVAAALLLADWARGPFVPGASDNASGVAAALALAEAWQEAPVGDAEVLVLFTGCEETGLLGAAAWRDRSRREGNAPPTTFLNLDGLGFGPPRFLAYELPAVGPRFAYPAHLLDIAARQAAEAHLVDAGPHGVIGPTDGLAFLAGGLPGLTLVGFQDGGYLPHYHLPSDIAEHVDFDAAWHGVEFAARLMRSLAGG